MPVIGKRVVCFLITISGPVILAGMNQHHLVKRHKWGEIFMFEEFLGLSDIDFSALKLECWVVCKGAAVNTLENIFRMKRRFNSE